MGEKIIGTIKEVELTDAHWGELTITTSNGEVVKVGLPHGSGIDCDYAFYESRNYWVVWNSYHYMNEGGMYMGYADFCIKIPKGGRVEEMSSDFVLKFSVTSQERYWVNKLGLRDYLEDTYALFLEQSECVDNWQVMTVTMS